MNFKKSLLNDFPAVTTQEWESVINVDLKGKDYERALVWNTYEKIKIKPYYRAENLTELEYLTETKIAEYPYLRGVCDCSNSWRICDEIEIIDPKDANFKAKASIKKGANALMFVVKGKSLLKSDIEWSQLLNGIDVEKVRLHFKGIGRSRVPFFVSYLNAMKVNLTEVKGTFAMDPLGDLVKEGIFEDNHIESGITTLIKHQKDLPNFRFICVSAVNFNNAGASSVEELAFGLSMAVEYLNMLTDRGLSAKQVAKNFTFEFGVSSNYFMEIAKLRAARVLWANIAKSFGVEGCGAKMKTRAITSDWNKTIYDMHVNILRTTTEAMSAALGGVDTLIVKAFDSVCAKQNDFSDRVAINIQNILKEESHFDKVIDPAGGSYYIENLTNSIIEEAWKLFLEVETKGGFFAAFKAGFVQEIVEKTTAKRRSDLAMRKENLLGTNQFPKFGEEILGNIDENIAFPKKAVHAHTIAKPLNIGRGAEDFEKLRLKTEKSGRKPKVFMLTYGSLAMRLARAQFSGNFVGIAGFEIIDNNGFKTVEEGVRAAIDKKADIVILCSSDEEYAEAAPKAFEALDGKAIFVVAGNPECTEDLKAKGIKHFINVKSNILATLQELQAELKIK